jgi:hypothetical protein
MTKIILTLSIFITVLSYGQITTTKVTTIVDLDSSKPYDSLSNFLGENAHKYIGQELYLIGRPVSLRKYGYSGFDTTKYDGLAENYFEVLDVIYDDYNKKYTLKLQEKSTENILNFNYDSKFKHSFPFIVVGFYEKLKKDYIGKKYVFAKNYLTSLDLNTGKPIVFQLGDIWECIDLTIDENLYQLSFVLTDKMGQKLLYNYEYFVPEKFYYFYTAEEAKKYSKKFGVKIWETILEGNVKIGMTKEMCKLSWGKPKDINTTISSGMKSEQWVYDDNYLYFTNGVQIPVILTT